MKKTLLSLSAALLAGTSMAATPNQLAANKGLTMPEFNPTQSIPNQKVSLAERAKMVDASAFNGFRKSPVKVAAEDMSIITEAPVGQEVLYSRSGYGFYVYFWWVMFGQHSATAADIVWGDDGYAYLYNPFCGWATNSYLKCEVKDNKLVAELPQPIYEETYEEVTTTYYADLLYRDIDEEGNVSYYASATDEVRTVSWTIDGDNLSLDIEYDDTPDEDGNLSYPEMMFGMVDPEGTWTIAGDCAQIYEKVDYKLVEAPENLELQDWVLISDEAGSLIKVGFDGNDVYMTQLYSYVPDAYVKGSVDGDKIVFDSKQYMGQAFGYFVHFMGFTYDAEGYYYIADNVTFNYDAENHVMSTDPGVAMVVNAATDRMYYLDLFNDPKLKLHNPNPNPQPCDPIPASYNDYLQSYGYNYLQFTLSNLNTEDELLDTENMYYEVSIDDELWVFEPDDDYWIDEPMDKIPYNFTDGNSFFASGVSHSVYFYCEGYDTIGLQLFNVVDGKTYASNIAVYDLATNSYSIKTTDGSSVDSISNSAPSSVEFYNLNGVKVANPSNGIFVCKKTFEDGSSKVSKVIVK